MKFFFSTRILLAPLIFWLLGLIASPVPPLFAGDKRMSVLLPPAVNLKNRTVAVQVTAQKDVPGALAERIQTKFIARIREDREIIVDEVQGQTLILIQLTNFRIEPLTFEVGTENKKHTCKVFTGRLEGTYSALQRSRKIPLDSANLISEVRHDAPPPNAAAALERVFEPTTKRGLMGLLVDPWKHILPTKTQGGCSTRAAFSEGAATDELVDGLLHQFAKRATAVDQDFIVRLPGGKEFRPLENHAKADDWVALYDKARAMARFPGEEDEAKRQFYLGLTQEAQAYQKLKDEARSRGNLSADVCGQEAVHALEAMTSAQETVDTLLNRAAGHYRDAHKLKAEDEYDRARRRINFATLTSNVLAYNLKEYVSSLRKVCDPDVTKGPPEAPAETNGEVIRLLQSQVPESVIIRFITDAVNPKFDVSSTDAISEFFRARGSEKLFNAMKSRMEALKSGPTMRPEPTAGASPEVPEEVVAAPPPAAAVVPPVARPGRRPSRQIKVSAPPSPSEQAAPPAKPSPVKPPATPKKVQ